MDERRKKIEQILSGVGLDKSYVMALTSAIYDLSPQWISVEDRLPEEIGWYWYKDFKDSVPTILHMEGHIGIGEHLGELLVRGWPVSMQKGFYAGPLPQPPRD